MDRKDLYLSLALVAAMGIWLIIFALPDDRLQVWFFDVGQGDAVFIKTPENHQILIDGGPDRTVLSQLSSAMSFWDKSLDAVFITHPHADHITGVIEVLKNYQVGKIFINPVVYDSPAYSELTDLIEARSIASVHFLKGDEVVLGDVRVTSFWPPRQTSIFEAEDVNKASMVFRLDYGEFSALFTGDGELSIEENPELAIYNWQTVDVLKVPHQGSRGALSSDVLEKLQPSLAVIPVGEDNKFGHPSQEVLDLLQEFGIVVKRTDRDGTTKVISTGGNNYTVISEY